MRPHSTFATHDAWRVVRLCVATLLLAAATGGCGAETGGGGGLFDFPQRVIFAGWETIGGGVCRGWLMNDGSHPATNARVEVWYSTPQGDTMLTLVPNSTTIKSRAVVAFLAPAQITRGEARFPGFAGTSWDGSGGSTVRAPTRIVLSLRGDWCRLGPDSAQCTIDSDNAVAYHIVLNVETVAGTVQIHPLQEPLGVEYLGYVPVVQGETSRYAQSFLHAPVRDSAGVKLVPRVISIQWENYAGVADSLLPAYVADTLTRCP